MATRDIVYLRGGNDIRKVVPYFRELSGKKFPDFEELKNWESARERIYELLNGATLLCQSAVVQQYNEYIIADQCCIENVIAPLNFISLDERNIPILGFPCFQPLIQPADFYRYNDEECMLELGMFAEQYNVDFESVRKFIRNIKDLCCDFGLREDDILCNLSNIGYNKKYGFRVIDFGLIESMGQRKFELVM